MKALILGCTHYPFAADAIARAAGPGVRLLDPAEPVARRVRDVAPDTPGQPALCLQATGDAAPLQRMADAALPGAPRVVVIGPELLDPVAGPGAGTAP